MSIRKIPASYIILTISNLIAIYFAITQHWTLGEVAWLYFFQSSVIGVFNFFKIISLKKFSTSELTKDGYPVPANSPKVRYFTAFFFLVHYGFFQLFFGLLLWEDRLALAKLLTDPFFLSTFILFIINYFFSFLSNYKNDREANLDINIVMAFPYVRVLPMLIAGGLIASKVVDEKFLLYFMIVKTFADIATLAIEQALAFPRQSLAILKK